MDEPKISILLCTKDRCADLALTLESLFEEIEGRDDVEVLAIDNGSSDGTADLLAYKAKQWEWLRPLSLPIRGKSRALNLGLKESRGEVLVLTDDDVRFHPGWLVAMTTGIEEGHFEGAVGQIVVPDDRNLPWMTDLHRALMAATTHFPRTGQGDMVGAGMAFHRRVLNTVPGFDPELGPAELGFFEDTLFSNQAKQAGYRVAYAHQAICYHHFRKDRLTRRGFLHRMLGQGKAEGWARYHWFHADWPLDAVQSALEQSHAQSEAIFATEDQDLPVTDQELIFLNRYGNFLQFIEESKRPRNYRKMGLTRVQPDPRAEELAAPQA